MTQRNNCKKVEVHKRHFTCQIKMLNYSGLQITGNYINDKTEVLNLKK